MMKARKAKLVSKEWPVIGFGYVPPKKASVDEYLMRIETAYKILVPAISDIRY